VSACTVEDMAEHGWTPESHRNGAGGEHRDAPLDQSPNEAEMQQRSSAKSCNKVQQLIPELCNVFRYVRSRLLSIHPAVVALNLAAFRLVVVSQRIWRFQSVSATATGPNRWFRDAGNGGRQ
jgi:hypothetical protein